jgi:hypothetical protein
MTQATFHCFARDEIVFAARSRLCRRAADLQSRPLAARHLIAMFGAMVSKQ